MNGSARSQAPEVRVVSDESEWEKLRSDWSELFDACPRAATALHFDWMWTWWRVYGRHYARPDGSYGGECPACQGDLTGTNGDDPVCENRCIPDEIHDGLHEAAMEQCAVFEGGFTLESAEATLDLSAYEGAPWPTDAVQSLVDKSFVRALGNERFDLLVSVQEYASEHLRTEGRYPGSGRAAAGSAEARHWTYFAKLNRTKISGQNAEQFGLGSGCKLDGISGLAVAQSGESEPMFNFARQKNEVVDPIAIDIGS